MATKGEKVKKGKKGKKGKKNEKERLAEVDKTFYELTITDLNRKLARLRSYVTTQDETVLQLKEKMRSTEEDRVDVAAHLGRTLAEREEVITKLEDKLAEIIKQRSIEKQEATEHIKDLEAKNKAIRNQLTSEIKLLNGKLNSLDEFRIQRDYLMRRFDDLEQELKEKERLHQEAIYSMEQNAVVEKDALKKEIEAKLLQVSEDFTRSSEIRNAGYTRRLIRENIALQKEIEVLVLSQIKIQGDFNEQVAKHKEISEQYAALDQLKTQLIHSSQNKVNIIEKLAARYEKLKFKYTENLKYRSLYENIMRRDVCERFNFNDTSKKLRAMGQRLEKLTMEKNRMLAIHKQHEYEISRLQAVIEQIKKALTTSIMREVGKEEKEKENEEKGKVTPLRARDTAEDEAIVREITRRDLISELVDIISSHLDYYPRTPSILSLAHSRSSIYRPGRMGLLPRTRSSLMEIFKRETKDATSVAILSSEFKLQSQASKIIPKARTSNIGSIVDVELGSTFYASSSHENLRGLQSDEEEAGEEASSDDYQSSEPIQPEVTEENAVAADYNTPPTRTSSVSEEVEEKESDGLSSRSRLSSTSLKKSSLLSETDADAFEINLFY
uniref:Cilia- and flagella-associated protein 157 n=1 Tax=Glossina morsitans morsitans TaxID=37546 RepID=A0A1B0FK51_GLOMM